MAHIVWDWNGTLFDDREVTTRALHAVLAWAKVDPVDEDTYRRLYVRPVRLFYERLFGRTIEHGEWVELDDVWHDAYAAAVDDAELTVGAMSVLAALEEDGHTQSLLSMYRHEQLLQLVDKFSIGQHFLRTDGLQGPGGGQKAPHLRTHLSHLSDVIRLPRDAMVIGDALDDAQAALACGARCALFDGGSHPREELDRSGAPVIENLRAVMVLAKGFG